MLFLKVQSWVFVSVDVPLFAGSLRVPDDSDSRSGVIRQRQNCLESQRLEGQELPVLTLAPCIGKEGVPAVTQVSSSGGEGE